MPTPMPDIEWGGHLVDILFEFGPVKAEGPLEVADILGIQKVLGVKFAPWESRLLIRMSREYKGEMHAATKRDAKPPFEEAAQAWRRLQNRRSASNLDKFLA